MAFHTGAGSPTFRQRLFGVPLPDWRTLPFLGTVKVQKELKIQNKRLAWLHSFLLAIAIGIVIYNIIYEQPWWAVYSPRERGLEFWTEDAKREVRLYTPPYCHAGNLSAYTYNYGSGWHYAPSRCKRLPAGEKSRKLGGILFFPTYCSDLYVTQHIGQQECALERTKCAAAGGNFTSSREDDSCECNRPEEFLVSNVETLIIRFKHGYKAHNQIARSHENSVVDRSYDGDTLQSKARAPGILSVIRSPDGRECFVGGKSRWLPQDGSIAGSLAEWLRCGNVNLDAPEPSLRPSESGDAPRARIAGANLELVLTYSNLRNSQVDWDGPVCSIWINAFPVWNSQTGTDYAVLPDPAAPSAGATWRYRYSYGVSVSLSVDGTIGIFDFFRLFTAIMTNIVLLGLPIRVVTFVAIHGAGAASVIYKRIQAESFNIKNEFHGFVARLLGHGQSFRGLTSTEHLSAASLKQDELVRFMKEAFMVEERRSGRTSGTSGKVGRSLTRFVSDQDTFSRAMVGHATDQTVDDLAQVVLAGCDPEGDGAVSLAEFIYAASCNESLHMNEVIAFFDLNRKKGIMERFFGDTEFDPEKMRVHLTRQQRKVGMSSPSASAGSAVLKVCGSRTIAPEGGSSCEVEEIDINRVTANDRVPTNSTTPDVMESGSIDLGVDSRSHKKVTKAWT